jgi:hypothetical protein
MAIELQSDEGKEILRNIKIIRRHLEPEVVAREDAEKARNLKTATRAYRAREADASWQIRRTPLAPIEPRE